MRGLRMGIKDLAKAKKSKGNYVAMANDQRTLGKLYRKYTPNNPLVYVLMEC